MSPKEGDPLPSLEAFEQKIAKARGAPPKAAEPSASNGMGLAMRLGVELTSGVAVGAFVGYWLDKWLGTSPWFFLLCFCLGTAGGVLTMMRSVQAASRNDDSGEKNP